MVWSQGGNQLPAVLGYERLAHMNLANLLQNSFLRYSCEHHERRPGNRGIRFPQLLCFTLFTEIEFSVGTVSNADPTHLARYIATVNYRIAVLRRGFADSRRAR
jgi:hypothetical protein